MRRIACVIVIGAAALVALAACGGPMAKVIDPLPAPIQGPEPKVGQGQTASRPAD
jgi:hypothetical protein